MSTPETEFPNTEIVDIMSGIQPIMAIEKDNKFFRIVYVHDEKEGSRTAFQTWSGTQWIYVVPTLYADVLIEMIMATEHISNNLESLSHHIHVLKLSDHPGF